MESFKPHNNENFSVTVQYYPTNLTRKSKPSLQIVNTLSAIAHPEMQETLARV